ncbi:MAG TPA: TlpA family protein disulfide reductase [Clostridiales bacterium]|jgi:thiol-disulfide isomerase/thioredoxin|nr:TlpA family protein disulfide reductase [Clostridiales bacterium]
MKKLYLTLMTLAVLLLFSACGGSTAADTDNNTASSASLSGMTTTDIEGNAVDQALFGDRQLTMVNFWSTTCPPCIREMPDLAELHTAHEGFQVVGIVLNISESNMDKLPTVLDIVEQTGADYPHLAVSESLYEAKVKDIQYVPETIFVDSEGNQVGEAYVGAKEYDEWNEIIEELLQEVE